jgi:hypothetical protein
MDAARGPSATAVNSDDAACGALDQLCGMIRKRDKRISGFGHEQALQKNIAWPGYGIAAQSLLLARMTGRSLGHSPMVSHKVLIPMCAKAGQCTVPALRVMFPMPNLRTIVAAYVAGYFGWH